MSSTTFEKFSEQLVGRRVVPVVRDFFADGETPVGIYRKLAQGRPGTFLLESAEQGGIWSRYSFIGVGAYGVLTQVGDEAAWIDYGLSAERAFGAPVPTAPLEAATALFARWETSEIPDLPPLTGGLIGFVGWEAVRQLERLPNLPPAEGAIPGQALSFVSDLVVVDHRIGVVKLISAVLNDGGLNSQAGWLEAQDRLDAMQAALEAPSEAFLSEIDFDVAAESTSRVTKTEFLDSVMAAKEYVRQGDVFQVVISQRFEIEVKSEPLDIYRVLRSLNPSPYMYLLSFEQVDGEPYWIVGSSPEALVKVSHGHVVTHPIAGSRPRGESPERDIEFENDLLDDAKERAEHLMLVDLSRNDLSKVCKAGSIEVTEFMKVERYSHIMHLVSTVEGAIREGLNALDVFRATFPAGTLSGAPKPRALEIIDELEPAQRGAYGGVVGYFGFAGDADLAIAIRTATISDGVARVQAGAGLVADSDPEAEYEESRNKAAAPLRAVAIANAMTRISGL